MSHYSTELLVKERIASWQRQAGNERLVRPRVERQASTSTTSPYGEPTLGHRLAGLLAPLRRLVARYTLAG